MRSSADSAAGANRVQPGEEGGGFGGPAILGGEARVLEPVVIGAGSQRRRLHRILPQQPLIMVGEQPVEIVGRRGADGRGGREQGEGKGKGDEGCAHGPLPGNRAILSAAAAAARVAKAEVRGGDRAAFRRPPATGSVQTSLAMGEESS